MATIYDNLPRNKILLAILNAYGGVATNPNSQDAILADIVVACGGVVTNPNNRNSLLADIVEATSGCNVYPFSSADADYLEIAPFTGNFKIILAATSEAGIPAAIQAGLQGSFIPSTDPVNDPQWNKYEINGAAPAVVLEATFTGVCGGYAKDDVWYNVDMGVPSYVYDLANSSSYFTTSENILLEAGDTIELDYIANPTIDTSNHWIVDTLTHSPRAAFAYVNRSVWISSSVELEIDGEPVVKYAPAPRDGIEHRIKLTALETCYVGTFGARYSWLTELGGMNIKNVVITRATGDILLPLTNVGDGALQTSNTSITATIGEYNQDGWVEYKTKDVGNNPYTYMLFFGDSYIARAYHTGSEEDDMYNALAKYGVHSTVISSAESGRDFAYFNNTLMPNAVGSYGALPNVACFIQSTVNSVDFDWDAATDEQRQEVTDDFQGTVDQSTNTGWTTFTKNFPFAPQQGARNQEAWNSGLALPIAQNSAPISLDGSGYFYLDNTAFSLVNDGIFYASDNLHYKEGSGDRAIRQFEAACIANRLGKLPPTSLTGRRIVLSWGGTESPYWEEYNNIARLAHSTPTATPSIPSKAINCQVIDADTGEAIPWLYVVVDGYNEVNLTGGSGNAGNTSSTHLNNEALSGNFSHDNTYSEMTIEIGNIYDITLPSATVTIAASSNISNATSKADWTCGGTTQEIDASLIPCGAATFANVEPVDNKITAVGIISSGSLNSYLSAIEVQFNQE